MDDTIAAIATAPGEAGLAVVRVSGPTAVVITDRVFRGAAPLATAPSHTLHHGWLVLPDTERRVDEVVAALFLAPRSYTREHVVELSCHGGRLSVARVLDAVLAAGARLARAGEFTLRAFLNGRIDLAQAEAVADLIHAETEAAREVALSQLAGELSRALDATTEALMVHLAEIEARVDFAEDVGGVEVPPHVVAGLEQAAAALAGMIAGAPFARAVREGIRLPLVGRPNAGKSSLFNRLLGEERAIVTPTPGTTRDRVSEGVEIGGIRFTLSDTAGLRDAGEAVESIGIERARQALAESRLVLWVVDGSEALGEEDRRIAARLDGKRVLVALNKSDLPARVEAHDVEAMGVGDARRVVAVSAAGGTGIEGLRSALLELLDGPGAGARGFTGALGNPRHVESLTRARAALDRAAAAGRDAAPGEIVALELREAVEAIGEVTGRTVGEDLLDRIFARFCIGK